FNRLKKRYGQKCAIKTAVKIPIGTPRIKAPNVTYSEPTIIGKIPNSLLDGRQILPNKNSFRPISLIAGRPLENKNTQISKTDITEIQAVRKNTTCIVFSLV